MKPTNFTKNSDESKGAASKQYSDDKRLESLRKKKEEYKAKKELLAASFNQLDGPKNKKIKFDNGSDDDNDDTVTNSTDVEGNKRSKTLFSDSSDSESDKDLNNKSVVAIDIRPELSGKRGQKLQQLEAKLGYDPRFKMNHKFLDEGDKDSSGEEMELEKSKQMSILNRVLQKDAGSGSLRSKKGGKNTVAQLGRGVRFDPSMPDHGMFDLDAKPSKESDSNSSSSEDEQKRKYETAAPPVPTASYFSMDQTFAEALKQKLILEQKSETNADARPKFSLLESLGRKSEQTETKKDVYKEEVIRSSLPNFLQHEASSSSEGEEDVSPSASKDSEDKLNVDVKKGGEELFFLTLETPCLVEALNRFKRTEKLEVIRKKWETYRPSLVKSYRKQEREAHLRQKRGAFADARMSKNDKKQKKNDG